MRRQYAIRDFGNCHTGPMTPMAYDQAQHRPEIIGHITYVHPVELLDHGHPRSAVRLGPEAARSRNRTRCAISRTHRYTMLRESTTDWTERIRLELVVYDERKRMNERMWMWVGCLGQGMRRPATLSLRNQIGFGFGVVLYQVNAFCS